MIFWIDIANSPHATFFEPIARELEARGHKVVVTVWDRANTQELAHAVWPEAVVVGEGNRKGLIGKATRISSRATALRPHVPTGSDVIALGHNSYSQLVAARRMKVPSITMMDYEHQPANHLAFRLANKVMVPDCYPEKQLRRQGASKKARRYSGFKEEITLAGFEPAADFRSELGVGSDDVLAVCRPAAEGALYHRHRNELFDQVLDHLVAHGATTIVTPRNRPQKEAYDRPGIRVLEHAVDGRNLLATSDLVIGAGGTMTREAALLGVPTYSLFSGRPAAVDAALTEVTPLSYVKEPSDIAGIKVEAKRHPVRVQDDAPVRRLVDHIEEDAGTLLR